MKYAFKQLPLRFYGVGKIDKNPKYEEFYRKWYNSLGISLRIVKFLKRFHKLKKIFHGNYHLRKSHRRHNNSCVSVVRFSSAVLTCPPLTPPTNGMILSPTCSSYYGATCQLGCVSGFNLQGGSATVTCQKNGNSAQWTPDPSSLQCTGKL